MEFLEVLRSMGVMVIVLVVASLLAYLILAAEIVVKRYYVRSDWKDASVLSNIRGAFWDYFHGHHIRL